MLVKHTVVVTKGKEWIGKFSKVIEMQGIPPLNCSVTFGMTERQYAGVVKQISYDEKDKLFAAYYEVDILSEESNFNNYIGDDYYPKKLVQECGFEIEHMEEEYCKLYIELTNNEK